MTETAQIPIWRKGVIVDHALVDASDFHRLNQQTWRLVGNGYAVDSHGVYMARDVVGFAVGDKRAVHHINEAPLDNRRENLLVCASRGEANRQPHPKANASRRSHISRWFRLYTFTELRRMGRAR